MVLIFQGGSMHNIMSHNQLAEWNHFETQGRHNSSNEVLNDYYDCLIECEGEHARCKRICKEILM